MNIYVLAWRAVDDGVWQLGWWHYPGGGRMPGYSCRMLDGSRE